MNCKSFCIITLMCVLICACGPNKSNETQGEKEGGPQIGQPMMGGAERPEPSPELQALIDETVPYFKQAILSMKRKTRFSTTFSLHKISKKARNTPSFFSWLMQAHRVPIRLLH